MSGGETRRAALRVEGLLASLAASPLAWILQLVASYGVSSHACRPGDAPRLAPPAAGWGGEELGLMVLNLACLALCLSAGAASFRAWRRSGREGPGGAAAALEVGEGRTRFLALCGLLAAGGFALAILFDTAMPLLTPPCWRFV